MRIETTSTEYVIHIDRSTFTPDDIERLFRNVRLEELASRLSGTVDEADELADELMQQWWNSSQPNA